MPANSARTQRAPRDTGGNADGVKDTRTRILATARDEFLRNGYAGTSTTAIGKALGISAPALYWHFRSKESILFALIEERLADFVRILDAIEIDDSEPARRLGELVRTYVGVQLSLSLDAAGYASLASVAQTDHILTPEHQRALAATQRGIYERFRMTLEAGAGAGEFDLGDPVATAFAIISMCEHVLDWARPSGRLAPEAIADEYVALALRMAGARPA